MSDFDTDLAHVEKIRATVQDMRKHGLRGMVPQEEALHLLGFIDNLWREYTTTLARADSALEPRAICKSCTQEIDLSKPHDCPGLGASFATIRQSRFHAEDFEVHWDNARSSYGMLDEKEAKFMAAHMNEAYRAGLRAAQPPADEHSYATKDEIFRAGTTQARFRYRYRDALMKISEGPPGTLPNDEVAAWAGQIAAEALDDPCSAETKCASPIPESPTQTPGTAGTQPEGASALPSGEDGP